MNSTHGHEVIAFINNAKPKIKKDQLESKIKEKFKDAKFHTCSKENMTTQELLEFLKSTNKLHFVNGEATIKTGNVCSHD